MHPVLTFFYCALISILWQIKNKYGGLKKPGGKFYDIGSGTGKPVRVLVSLLHCGCTLVLVLLVPCASPRVSLTCGWVLVNVYDCRRLQRRCCMTLTL